MFKYSVFSSAKILFVCLITIAFYSTGFALSGSGTSGDPYVITSVADFDVFANPANAATYWASGVHTKLACDIDLPGTYATAVIAPDTDNTNEQTFDGIEFAGEFNGNDYKITNLTIDSAGVKNSYLGLFGQIAAEGQVMNLGIENVNVTSNGSEAATYFIGGLCGRSLGTITNCYTTGNVSGTITGYIGGLAGQNEAGGIINSCYSNVSVSTGEGSGFIGGLAGVNIAADINNCYATGSVTATYNTDWLGGLIGINIVMTGGEFSTVSNCYATGSVANGNASSNIGGLAGENNGVGASVNDCFWDIETGGPDNSVGTGKTTAQMQNMNTYLDTEWDFIGEADNGTDDYWRQPYQVGYPILYWQRDIPGDFTGSYGVNFEDFAVFAKDWLAAANGLAPEQTAQFSGPAIVCGSFGRSVAIDGDVAIIGAGDGVNPGRAYLFDLTTGTQLYKLATSDSANRDYFGHSVAIDGNVAIVGASGIDSYTGAAYLFNATTGTQLAKLAASDAAASDYFGDSVGIDGNVAIVGVDGDDDGGSSSGSAYLFDVTTGTQLAKLTASDAATDDYFGYSVAIDGNVAIVGAPYNDDDGDYSGSAYLFDVTTGTPLAKLTASDAIAEDFFGYSVAIAGDVAIVGSYGYGSKYGSAYLFDVTTGTQIAKLTASDAAAEDYFGSSVAIAGNVAIVGASKDDDGSDDSGSAYLFNVTTGTQLAKLTASDAAVGDSFGGSVAIDGDVAIVGAASKRGGYISQGAVYLFENKGITRSETNLNKSGSIDIEDLMIFCDNWLANGPSVTVPDVVDTEQSAAETAIIDAGLTVGTITQDFSDTVVAGNVISQNPAAGELLPLSEAVDLVVSLGLPIIPDVTGMTQAAAEAAITVATFTVGTVTTSCSDTVAAGNVINQNPIGGTSATSGTVVDLVVSLGPEVTVPDVVDTEQSAAETTILNAGLSVGTITQEYSYTVVAGNVISQNPAAGELLPPSGTVDLVVSLGPYTTDDIVWVSINNDPGVSGHEPFNGEMSKYETTNAQYCQYLNDALDSNDITVSGNYVIGTSGPYSGLNYYRLDDVGDTKYGATNGGAARINWTGSSFTVDSGFENHPVTNVNSYGATEFASYYGWRLPTEWEWQAVADYDGSYTYGCGTTINTNIANYRTSTHPYGTTPVGMFGTYGYGMCDMAGNVEEWTSSSFLNYRMYRGGSWYDIDIFCDVASGAGQDDDDLKSFTGFRVCR